MAAEEREGVAAEYERMADELEAAAKHVRVAARHMREHEVPRGCAHAFAAYGHIRRVMRAFDAVSDLHASRASIEPPVVERS